MTATTLPAADSDTLARLRSLAAADPGAAKRQAWRWLRELQTPGGQHRLAALFAAGTYAEPPHGDCAGMVMNLYGAPWLVGVDRAVRLGQLLGGIGWAGKSFDTVTRTGYNRLTPFTRVAALLVMPRYRFDTLAGELIGFRFHFRREASPIATTGDVVAITYDDPAHANPLVLPRTRDELVALVPHVYLGRVLIREPAGWQVCGYFALRYPVAEGA